MPVIMAYLPLNYNAIQLVYFTFYSLPTYLVAISFLGSIVLTSLFLFYLRTLQVLTLSRGLVSS